MKLSLLTLQCLMVAVHGEVAVFSVGDLGQYDVAKNPAPTMSGNVISYSGDVKAGIDIVLSPDLARKVQEVAKQDCHPFNNKCFDSIKAVLKQPDTYLDSRQVGAALAVGAAFSAVISLIIGLKMETDPNYNPWGVHMPPKQLSPATSVATASEIAIAIGDQKPTLTITQAIPGSSITRADRPSVTAYTEAVDGHQKGEVVIFLPDDLAKRASEIIARFSECADDSKKLRIRAPDAARQARCAARAVAVNAVAQGPLADLLIMRMPQLNFRDPALIGAVNDAIAWVRQQAANINIPEDAMQDILDGARLGFDLGIIISNGMRLGRANTVPASLLRTDNPTEPPQSMTASASSCSTSAPCIVTCSLKGVIELCRTNCPSCAITTGKLVSTTTNMWAWPTELPPLEPLYDCEMVGDLSEMPWNVFQSIPDKFCSAVEKDATKPLTWFVDSKGDEVPRPDKKINAHQIAIADLTKRTPPPDANQYKDHRVTLKWDPREADKDFCFKDCKASFEYIYSRECGHAGAQKNIMTTDGEVDNGCGVYSYHIEKVEPSKNTDVPLAVGPRTCFTSADVPKHGDVNPNDQNRWTKHVCMNEISITPGSRGIQWTPTKWMKEALLSYSITWVEGCTTTVEEQNAKFPVDGAACVTLMRENFEKCTGNQGIGGWIQAGCLKYEFKGHD